MVENLNEALVKVKTGSLIGLDRQRSIEMMFLPTHNRHDINQRLGVGEYLVIHCQSEPEKDRINNAYIELMRNERDCSDLAKAVCAHIFDQIILYALKQLNTLSIKVSAEELADCKERCWEELVEKIESHLVEVKGKVLSEHLFKYVKSYGMFLSGKSLTRTAQETGYKTNELRAMKVAWNWENLKKGLENLVMQVVKSSFDIERRVEAIRVSHYTAGVVDALGTEALNRLKDDMSDIPTDKVIKLFNETAALHAKLTGQQETPDQVVNIGIANVFKKLDEIDPKALPDVRPERKQIE